MTDRQLGCENLVNRGAMRSPRRWLQFPLRTLLLVFLLVAVFLGGRESGLQWLDREREQTDAARRNAVRAKADADMAKAALRLQLLTIEMTQASNALRQAEENYQRAHQEVLRHEAMLLQSQAEIDRLIRERERFRRWMFPQDLVPGGTLTPARSSPAVESFRPQAVPINEFWQRPVRPERIRELPQAGVRPLRHMRSAAV